MKLRNNREYRVVYDKGRRFHTPYFTAFVVANDLSEPRLGITATKKIGKAVIRNRCKRRLREVIRRYYAANESAGYDIVLNAKTNLITANFTKLEVAFAEVIKKIKNENLKIEN